MNNIISQYKNDQVKPLLGSLFFHNSILNSKKRSLEKESNDCECTLHPGYLLNKTGFFCQEDYLMNVNIIKKTIAKNKDVFLDSSSLSLTKYLDTTSEEVISFEKLYRFYIDKELYLKTLDLIKNGNQEKSSQVARGDCAWWCPLGCGSDWGCCSNYSGCCLYTHPLCYIHDAFCTSCAYTWCFGGCVPDSV